MISVIAMAGIGCQDVCGACDVGIGGDSVETRHKTCICDDLPENTISVKTLPSARTFLSSVATSVLDSSVFPDHSLPKEVSYMTPAPATRSHQPSAQLSTSAQAGIISASIAVFFLLLLLTLEYTYLRHKRQDLTAERAIDDVEQGTELKDFTTSESKENMVLESRVEIIVEEEQSSVRDSWDEGSQWDGGTEGEDSDGDLGEWGRGRG